MTLRELKEHLCDCTAIQIVHINAEDIDWYDEFMHDSPLLDAVLGDKTVRKFAAAETDAVRVELDWSTGYIDIEN